MNSVQDEMAVYSKAEVLQLILDAQDADRQAHHFSGLYRRYKRRHDQVTRALMLCAALIFGLCCWVADLKGWL